MYLSVVFSMGKVVVEEAVAAAEEEPATSVARRDTSRVNAPTMKV